MRLCDYLIYLRRVGPATACERSSSLRHARQLICLRQRLHPASFQTARHVSDQCYSAEHFEPGCCVQEDDVLTRLVGLYGPRNWSVIASGIPGRTGKSCRLRCENVMGVGLTSRTCMLHRAATNIGLQSTASLPLRAGWLCLMRSSPIVRTQVVQPARPICEEKCIRRS